MQGRGGEESGEVRDVHGGGGGVFGQVREGVGADGRAVWVYAEVGGTRSVVVGFDGEERLICKALWVIGIGWVLHSLLIDVEVQEMECFTILPVHRVP